MANENELEEAFANVARAVEVLGVFHEQVAALLDVVDEKMQEAGTGAEAAGFASIHYRDLAFVSSSTKTDRPDAWIPWCFGLFFLDGSVVDTSTATNHTADRYDFAFVWPVLRHECLDEPEVWIGVATVGAGHSAKHAYDAAKKFWSHYAIRDAPGEALAAWTEGMLEHAHLGKGGGAPWALRRVPLRKIEDEASINRLLVEPLRDRFAAFVG